MKIATGHKLNQVLSKYEGSLQESKEKNTIKTMMMMMDTELK